MKKYKWGTHKVIQETKDTITIFFDTRQTDFVFQPGQFLNIACEIDGERVSRSYSFSSIPSDKFPAITLKRVTGGKMSNFLFNNSSKIGEWDIEAPFGNFILDQQILSTSKIVFLAGGSGISPLFSMLKSIGDITNIPLLLYSNKSPDDTIFYHELNEMHADNKVRAFFSFSGSSPNATQLNYLSGRFSELVIRSILGQDLQAIETAHYFICGPASLMDFYRNILISLHVPERQIHIEYFDPVVSKPIALHNDGLQKEVLVTYYENTFQDDEPKTYQCTSLIEVPSGQSLLDALKENGIKANNSCLNGTCGSCWAIKEKGEVKMLNNSALTTEQVAEGKILLCQSYPMNQEVSISVQ